MDKCKICRSTENIFINLIGVPKAAQNFWLEKTHHGTMNTTLTRCNRCGHIQINCEPPIYYKKVIRSAKVSLEMLTYRENQFEKLKKENNKLKVLEIGSGDGCYLKIMARTFGEAIGTEYNSCKQDKDAIIINTHPENRDFLEKSKEHGLFDIIFCLSYLEHITEPVLVLKKLKKLLKENGKLVIEVPNTELILEKGLLNEVISDHQHYFTTSSIIELSNMSDMTISSIENTWYRYIKTIELKHNHEKQQFMNLETNYNELRISIDSLLNENNCKSIVLWGAGHQALFTIMTTDLKNRINWIVDSSTDKQGSYVEGTEILIKSPETLQNLQKESKLIICCGGYNKEVIKEAKKINPDLDILEITDCKMRAVK